MEIFHRSKKKEIADIKTLPEDLILHSIIPLLPAKSAIRLMLVSKTWYAFIKRPIFIGLQLSVSRKRNPRTFLMVSRTASYLYPLTLNQVTIDNNGSIKDVGMSGFASMEDTKSYLYLDFSTSAWEVVGVCAGVVCVALECFALFWNPAIGVRSMVILKYLRSPCGGRKKWKIIGFGCLKDGMGNAVNFKLLIMGEEVENPGHYVFKIYWLNTRKWRVLETPSFGINTIVKKSCVNINGVLHWLAWGDSTDYSAFVLTFDITTEIFGKIKVPEQERHEPLCLRDCENYFTVFDDQHLMLVVPYEYKIEGQKCLDGWILFKEGNGKDKTVWKRVEKMMGPLMFFGTMLGYWDGIGVLITLDGGKLSLHAGEGKVRHYTSWHPTTKCYEYAESLVSPKHISEQEDFQKIY